MARALREYQVLGIRTTIPFFLWLMRQPDYREGRFDTTYLDRLLAERRGESFSELTAGDEELAAIAAALDAYPRARAPGRAARRGARAASAVEAAPRGARRCADDVRDRDQRAHAAAWRSSATARRAATASSSTARRTRSMPRASGEFGLSLIARRRVAARAARCRSRPAGAPGELLVDAWTAATVPASSNGRRTARGAPTAAARRRTGSRRSSRRCRDAWCACWWPPGDEVAARQGVVVVEAMKMENELRSPKAGTRQGSRGRRRGRRSRPGACSW